jgi:NAD(P)-dependent dehydrogenase (short-subunit alcohol dehydrogenase family)
MHKLSQRYPHRRVFITGAGAGIGRALCLELARAGWTVGVADINPATTAAVADEVTRAGGRAIPLVFDVADEAAFGRAADTFRAAAGGVDLVINNAGIGDTHEFEDTPDEVWARVDRINRLGVIYGCKAFVPTLRAQRSGHIVNVASVAAFASPPGLAAYASLSEVLFTELRHQGVDVSIVIPFIVTTELFTQAGRSTQSQRSAEKLNRLVGVDPATTARSIVRQLGRRKLYVPTSPGAAALHLWKRLMPVTFMKVHAALAQRMGRDVDSARPA